MQRLLTVPSVGYVWQKKEEHMGTKDDKKKRALNQENANGYSVVETS